ncbi:hypothetical protein MSAN_00430700 [Mycena sanguinolenta]|uniref:Uncharacterized protein n=1 Tax=Mycena sanguinolenta TaxID=230812 RepID=A0A8H7DHC2_9AGAR|nr:hypothetical protein MSAN_00430700 [Mycena sanguinolenta]
MLPGRIRRSPPPGPPPRPSAVRWGDSSLRAREHVERHIEAHETQCSENLGGIAKGVPRLIDLVGDRLAMENPETIYATLAEIPPVVLLSNMWRWHRIPYTVLRDILLRLFYDSAKEGAEWDPEGGIQNNIDEWILGNERYLLASGSQDWKHRLVTLDDAERIFPEYLLTNTERLIRRPDTLQGFSILDLGRPQWISIQRSTAAFKKNFNRMSDQLLQNLDWSNLFVAGGIVLASLMAGSSPRQWKSSDIDLYVYGLSPLEANKKIHHVFDTFCANLPPGTRTFVVRNSKTITFYAKYPLRRLQIVLKLVKSPREVLLNFDLDICAMGWDGTSVWMLPRTARALETGSNVFTMNLIYGHYLSDRRASQPQRVFKYASRGYGLRFLPSYVSSLQTAKNVSDDNSSPLNLEVIANKTRVSAKDWIHGLINLHFGHISSISPAVFPGYSLSGFAMLMRSVTLWEMGKTENIAVKDEWSNTSPYEDTPTKDSDAEYPWTEEFSATEYMSHIQKHNLKEVTRWLQSEPQRLRRHGVHSESGYEIYDMVQRVAGAATLDHLLHPVHDLCLPVLLPCHFAVYANDLVSKALASAGLRERKILEMAVRSYNYLGLSGPETEGLFIWRIAPDLMWQQFDRRVDEVFEVLHAFRRMNASLSDELLQAQRLDTELVRLERRRKESAEFDAFAGWVGARPVDLRPWSDNDILI